MSDDTKDVESRADQFSAEVKPLLDNYKLRFAAEILPHPAISHLVEPLIKGGLLNAKPVVVPAPEEESKDTPILDANGNKATTTPDTTPKA